MIDRLFGEILDHTQSTLTLLVGGVGLLVNVPRNVLENTHIGENMSLYTHLLVREDALTLFGFVDATDRSVFEALIKINGIGPRLAIAILSTLSVDHLRNAVLRDDAEVLGRVPGIGKKTAAKILLDLKDKMGWKGGLESASLMSDVDTDVMETLIALGYSIVEAQSAIQSIPVNTPKDIEERVRIALQYFASP